MLMDIEKKIFWNQQLTCFRMRWLFLSPCLTFTLLPNRKRGFRPPTAHQHAPAHRADVLGLERAADHIHQPRQVACQLLPAEPAWRAQCVSWCACVCMFVRFHYQRFLSGLSSAVSETLLLFINHLQSFCFTHWFRRRSVARISPWKVLGGPLGPSRRHQRVFVQWGV